MQFPMSEEAMKEDFVLPIGKAKIERPGEHITITAHSMAVKIALEAAAELEKSGVSVEVGAIVAVGSLQRRPDCRL